MDYYRTLSEASRETGLSTREIKYYIERDMIRPSKSEQKGERTYNLFSSSDVVKIQQIALYRELGYTNEQIKKVISDPSFSWKEALDLQISELKHQKRHLENRIIAAEFMKFIYSLEKFHDFDISFFNNNLDNFASECLSPEAEENTELGLMRFGRNIKQTPEKIKKYADPMMNFIGDFLRLLEKDPRSDDVQESFEILKDKYKSLFHVFFSDSDESMKTDFNSEEIQTICYLCFKIITSLGVDRVLDLLVGKNGTTEFIDNMFDEYFKREEEAIHG